MLPECVCEPVATEVVTSEPVPEFVTTLTVEDGPPEVKVCPWLPSVVVLNDGPVNDKPGTLCV